MLDSFPLLIYFQNNELVPKHLPWLSINYLYYAYELTDLNLFDVCQSMAVRISEYVSCDIGWLWWFSCCQVWRVVPISPQIFSAPDLEMSNFGTPGWLSGWASAFTPGHDHGIPGSNPVAGSLQGACFSLCLCLCLSLCVSHEWINKIFKKILKKKRIVTACQELCT